MAPRANCVGRNCPHGNRRGMTLAELLVACMVTGLVCAALAGFTHAIMLNFATVTNRNETSQTARVVLSRISRELANSLRTIPLPAVSDSPAVPDDILVIWQNDNQAPLGQANLEELVIYAMSPTRRNELWEIRPHGAKGKTLALDDPGQILTWLTFLRTGRDAEVHVLADNLDRVRFEVFESAAPEGLLGLVQQTIAVGLSVRPDQQPPTVNYGTATIRYVDDSNS